MKLFDVLLGTPYFASNTKSSRCEAVNSDRRILVGQRIPSRECFEGSALTRFASMRVSKQVV